MVDIVVAQELAGVEAFVDDLVVADNSERWLV